MAYSFTDLYRPLRQSMRINGLLVGLGQGSLLLLASANSLRAWGVVGEAPWWPARIAGAALCALGIFMIAASREETISVSILVAVTIANALIAAVLMLAYFGGDMADLTLAGRLLMIVMVAFTLGGAVLPLRYFRAEYQL